MSFHQQLERNQNLFFTEFDFRLAARANWGDVNSKRSLSMKMHLALAALAAVYSQASFAASESGDTWSEQQPQPVAGLPSRSRPQPPCSRPARRAFRLRPVKAPTPGPSLSCVRKPLDVHPSCL